MDFLKLAFFGELGVVLLLLINIIEVYRIPESSRPDISSVPYWLTYIVYSIFCLLIIFFINENPALQDFIGLKKEPTTGSISTVYCFYIGWSIPTIIKNLFQATHR